MTESPESHSRQGGGRAQEFNLPKGLDSGDIVLFNRRCMSMSLSGAALCMVAKFFSNSAWDHVGVVVKHPSTGELLFLEADFGGVKLRSLAERVKRSKSNEIAVRKLSVVRTDAMREALYAFSQKMLGRPYDLSTGSVIARVKNQEEKHEKDHYHSLLIEKKIQIQEINRELYTGALTPFQRTFLINERKRVERNIQIIEASLLRLQQQTNGNGNGSGNENRPELRTDTYDDDTFVDRGSIDSPPVEHPYEYSKDLSRVFCSELVAAAYQRIGLLESYPPAFSYNPKQFSSEQKNPPGVHLLRKARLGDEVYLRALPTRTLDQNSQLDLSASPRFGYPKPRFRGVEEDDNPARESKRLIREVLKRTPIYNTIPDEYKRSHFIKSFRARILEPGEVVFSQGDYGDSLFVIESGKVDRFVGKGHDDPILVSTLGPRNSFGLTAFSYTSKRGATIRARERTLLWQVDRPTYEMFRDTSESDSALSGADLRILRSLLTDHFLFKRLDRLGPRELDAFFPVRFRAGEEIFKQGDAGDNFYIIKSGEVERYIRHPRPPKADRAKERDRDGENENTLATTLYPAQSFGELSLMYNAPRAATVRARTDTECYAISAESFHRLNLGGGTQYLRTLFEVYASVNRDDKWYMTPHDFLYKFASVEKFPEEDRDRLSSLLISLVTSNRERDPINAVRKRQKATKEKRAESFALIAGEAGGQAKARKGKARSDKRSKSEDNTGSLDSLAEKDEDGTRILMDFWEFVRFDIVLNQPSPEMDFAFRLADDNNSGFISLEEMQYLLQMYSDIDDTARRMLSGELPTLRNVFGKDGSRTLSAKEFQTLSHDILPPLFRDDVRRVTEHMRNVELNRAEDDDRGYHDIRFFEQDGAPSIIGSHFVTQNGSNTVPSPFSDKTSKEKKRKPLAERIEFPLEHIICVGVAAAASRTAVAPLERLKVLMQTQGGSLRYRGLVSGLRTMVKQDRTIIRAMFRGNGANLLRIVPNAAIQPAAVESIRRAYASYFGKDGAEDSIKFQALERVVIGGFAGMVSTSVLYPLEFARGRLTIQRRGFEPYTGAFDVVRKTCANEGLGTVYRGILPSLLGVFPYVGITFAMYETLKPILPRRNDGTDMPSTGSAILSGGVAIASGQVAAYPLDTCRRRMQVAGFAEGVNVGPSGKVTLGGIAKEVYQKEGFLGFYRGIVPNLIKVVPSTMVSFMAFEYMRSGFNLLDILAVRTLGKKA